MRNRWWHTCHRPTPLWMAAPPDPPRDSGALRSLVFCAFVELCAEDAVGGLEFEHVPGADEVDPGVKQFDHAAHDREVIVAIAPGAASRAARSQETFALIKTQCLLTGTDQLGRDRDAVDAARAVRVTH